MAQRKMGLAPLLSFALAGVSFMSSTEPVLGMLTNVGSVHAGGGSVCSIDDLSYELKCWGNNEFGQLGLGTDVATAGTTSDSMGYHLPVVNLGTNRSVSVLSVGYSHACAILDNSKVKCWGNNMGAQLGIGVNVNFTGNQTNDMGDNLPYSLIGSEDAIDVKCGDLHTCVLFSSKRIRCFGGNYLGGLGLETGNITVGYDPAHMGDNLPFVDLGTTQGPSPTPLLASKIGVGALHTCVLIQQVSQVKCFGGGVDLDGYFRGQIGVPSTVAIGGNVGDMGDNLAYVNLGSVSVSDLAVGRFHNCAIVSGSGHTDSVKCWGDNSLGQLGLVTASIPLSIPNGAGQMGDSLPFVNLGSNVKVVRLALGDSFSCALTDQSKIKCWGTNNYGQLGLGVSTNHIPNAANQMGDNLPYISLATDLNVTYFSAGYRSSCVVLSNSKVKCWGSNEFGQLGVCSTANIGIASGQMGDNLPFSDDCGISYSPTNHPSASPTKKPTLKPTHSPSVSPSRNPTRLQVVAETAKPTTKAPTTPPELSPSELAIAVAVPIASVFLAGGWFFVVRWHHHKTKARYHMDHAGSITDEHHGKP